MPFSPLREREAHMIRADMMNTAKGRKLNLCEKMGRLTENSGRSA